MPDGGKYGFHRARSWSKFPGGDQGEFHGGRRASCDEAAIDIAMHAEVEEAPTTFKRLLEIAEQKAVVETVPLAYVSQFLWLMYRLLR